MGAHGLPQMVSWQNLVQRTIRCRITNAVQVWPLINAMHEQSVSVCRAVSSTRLVPGDVVVLLPGQATCDMVLLRGSCLLEESMLSGEVSHSLYSVCCAGRPCCANHI